MYSIKISLVLTLLSVSAFVVTDAKKAKNKKPNNKNQCTIDDLSDSLTEAQTRLAKNLLVQVKNIGTSIGSKTAVQVSSTFLNILRLMVVVVDVMMGVSLVPAHMIVGFLALVAKSASFVPRSFLSLN
jgi:hypothetical protein